MNTTNAQRLEKSAAKAFQIEDLHTYWVKKLGTAYLLLPDHHYEFSGKKEDK